MQITPFTSFRSISFVAFIVCAFVLLFSLPTTADTKLHVAEDVFLIAVNGKKISKGHPLYRKNPVTLDNGINQLLVQFNAGIEEQDDDDGLRYQRTEASVLVFDSSDQRLTLQAPLITTEAELDNFNKTLNWILKSKQGKSIPLKTAVLEKDGVQIGRDFERELEIFNETQSTAALVHLSRRPIVVLGSANTQQVVPVDNTDTSVIKRSNNYVVTKEQHAPAISIDWLLYLYKQASPSVQEQFKRIVNQ